MPQLLLLGHMHPVYPQGTPGTIPPEGLKPPPDEQRLQSVPATTAMKSSRKTKNAFQCDVKALIPVEFQVNMKLKGRSGYNIPNMSTPCPGI